MLVELLLLASALFLGFNIGSNDAANCMGACVGCGALSLRKAILLASAFVLIGGVIGGSSVTETISRGVIPQEDLTPVIAIVCLFISGGLVNIATLRGIPVSTSHAMVLAMVGAGLAIGASLNGTQLFWLATAWALLPFGVTGLSFLTVSLLNRLLARVGSLVLLEIILKYLLIFGGVYASFALGANHAGLAGGFLEGVNLTGRFWAMLIGSISISSGVLVLSRRVIVTVGREITPLGPRSAFAMQFSAALGLTVCSMFGIPVSSSQAIVGAAIGVGFAEGGSSVNFRQVSRISLYWVALPLAAMALAYVAVRAGG